MLDVLIFINVILGENSVFVLTKLKMIQFNVCIILFSPGILQREASQVIILLI